ncbi:hypothetical protein SAMN05660690_2752 [Geodermatophilus telluris]|uniref:PH domain-containing protein n=1 Tax=Geodermatophilus telluris TaxID=1190417 RepID=A0A1G6Q6R0_9ACTN|nr:hypothetical protein [Geodermatophilus telluris]SDC88170.1 hypothetical protein SAMN05660690_2752 [Geodermatophilus telluris]
MRALRWTAPGVLAVEAVLVLGGRLSVGAAALVFVGVELLLTAAVVAGATRRFGRERAGGGDRAQALAAALRAGLPRPVATALLHEARIVASLVLFLRRRRHGVPVGAVAIGYERALRPLAVTFLVLAVLELVVVEVAVPWPAVRAVLLVLGVYTGLVVAGMAAGNVVRPHVLTGTALRLRSGTWADVSIPLDRVAHATVRRRVAPDRTVAVEDGVLAMGIGGGTTVDVTLTAPTELTVGRRRETVSALRFAADDPADAVAAIRAARTAVAP